MPTTPVITATPGVADANSYATAAEFTAFWQSRTFNTVPLAAAADDVAAALTQAARLLDSSFVWTGTPVDDVQALTWPRSGMFTRNNYAIATTVIPQGLKDAQCQLAGDLIIANREEDNDAAKLGITGVKVGSVDVTFAKQLADSSTADLRNADITQAGPAFAWMSRAISDAARALLVDSWYVRRSVTEPFMFEAMR